MRVKIALFDVEGVFTDGTTSHWCDSVYPADAKMHSSMSFNTRDMHGINLLHENDIPVYLITSCNNGLIPKVFQKRAPHAKCVHSMDKLKTAREISKDTLVLLSDMSYMGDDVIDLPLLKAVGLPSCPSDAHYEVAREVRAIDDGMVIDNLGGHGCVRDLCDLLLF